MTLNVQTDDGTATDANGYLSVADFKSYHDDRGNDYSSYNDTDIQNALVRATDYVDTRFRYKGVPLTADQPTEWPREGVVDRRGDDVTGIPKAVKEATAEYALRALGKDLLPDPSRDKAVKSERKKVGSLEKETEYANPTDTQLPAYPLADEKLKRAGLTTGQRRVVRA